MFPIVHHLTDKTIDKTLGQLTILGGIFPDLAVGAGLDRNKAHQMGTQFYNWCKKAAPEGLPLARGIICHGDKPRGLDYYADEAWPPGERGWCFQMGIPFHQKVASSTGLPQNLIYWKAHNFIELGCELICHRQNPGLAKEILTAVSDRAAVKAASELLAAYTSINSETFAHCFNCVPHTFALEEVTPTRCAERQARDFTRRFNCNSSDITAMADLIEQIALEIPTDFNDFYIIVIKQMSAMLKEFNP